MSRVSPLFNAIFEGDCETVRLFLAGRDVNTTTEGDKWNLLHMALLSVTEPPNPAMIRQLVELGVNVNARDYDGWTPLHFAVRTRGPDADPSLQSASVKVLIDSGADVNAEDDRGVTPLHRSIWTYPWNFEMIEVLLAAGARKTTMFRRLIDAIASPEKDKLVELLAKYEKTVTPATEVGE